MQAKLGHKYVVGMYGVASVSARCGPDAGVHARTDMRGPIVSMVLRYKHTVMDLRHNLLQYPYAVLVITIATA